MKKGKFIVFEGIDGTGKTVLSGLAANYIFGKTGNVFLTREPTNQYKIIKERLAQAKDVNDSPEWYNNMYFADRIQHIKTIKPILNKGVNIICDRYKGTQIVYQSTQGIDLFKIIEMHEGLLVPDLTLILDCPAEISFKRKKGNGDTDIFDKDLEFQKKLRIGYLNLAEILDKENIKLIDANKPIDQVFENVKKELSLII